MDRINQLTADVHRLALELRSTCAAGNRAELVPALRRAVAAMAALYAATLTEFTGADRAAEDELASKIRLAMTEHVCRQLGGVDAGSN